MNYCLTMEQTRRIAVWFDADSDEEAEKKAREIYHNIPERVGTDRSHWDCPSQRWLWPSV